MNLECYLIAQEGYSIAQEGLGIDTRRAIKGSADYNKVHSLIKEAGKKYRAARVSKDTDDIQEAIKTIYECRKATDEFYSKIASMEEPTGFWQKLCTSLTPVLDAAFPEGETFFYGTGSMTTIYTSDESRETKNGVKKRYLHALNLVKKRLNGMVEQLQKVVDKQERLSKLSSKLSKDQ